MRSVIPLLRQRGGKRFQPRLNVGEQGLGNEGSQGDGWRSTSRDGVVGLSNPSSSCRTNAPLRRHNLLRRNDLRHSATDGWPTFEPLGNGGYFLCDARKSADDRHPDGRLNQDQTIAPCCFAFRRRRATLTTKAHRPIPKTAMVDGSGTAAAGAIVQFDATRT